MDEPYRWRRPPAHGLRYRLAWLLLLTGLGLELAAVVRADPWFAVSGVLALALGAVGVFKTAWRAIGG